jgi:drug/metabolite transporter (DMT)-like permease
LGILLVAASALIWSFGGPIARFIETPDPWTIIFWRSLWAALFLFGFLAVRDGMSGSLRLYRAMGTAGVMVALSFATASISFVIALQHTTVANILLMQTAVPLIAALLAWAMFGERTTAATWAAIAVVMLGIAVMVSDSLTGNVSPLGDGLALLIAVAFAFATVLVRRHATVRMTPATCLGAVIATLIAALMASRLLVSWTDMALLFAFGALNFGLGMACFATGARLVPAAIAALVGLLEPVAGPIWTWLIHGEVPTSRTLIGGGIVFVALLAHVLWQMTRSKPRGVTLAPSA